MSRFGKLNDPFEAYKARELSAGMAAVVAEIKEKLMPTICLLCPSPAVADSLCVLDGARLWCALEWEKDPEGMANKRDYPPAEVLYAPTASKKRPERIEGRTCEIHRLGNIGARMV